MGNVPPKEGSTDNSWISKPSAGIEKRHCTLKLMFRSEGKQPRLAALFRDTGKRISEDEK